MTHHLPKATAVAHSNIALAKYWGKKDETQNLPATPSLSMTLDALYTTTSVQFLEGLEEDEVTLNGSRLTGEDLERLSRFLGRIRNLSGLTLAARVESNNNFPTASGLASSASGFAALALGATRAAGLVLPRSEVSALARLGSASAARSLFGGYVALELDAACAHAVLPGDGFPLQLLVCVVTTLPKDKSSRSGMGHTAKTSPYYPAWVASAPSVYLRIHRALLAQDFEELGRATEHSALLMHASMFAAEPPLIYWSPTTLALLARVTELRSAGLPAYATMDAGPHVKVICEPINTRTLAAALELVPGVKQVIVCSPGPDASVKVEPS